MDNVFVGLFVVAVVFILLREFNCWYFKINELLSVNKEILAQLKIMNKQADNTEISPTKISEQIKSSVIIKDDNSTIIRR